MPVHLHGHSAYSLLEGTASLDTLIRRAVQCGYAALALTDTNNLYGAVTFVQRAREQGLRPLLGACLRQGRQRCVALMADRAGYRSLCRLLSRLHLDEPAPPLEQLLADHAEGLHVLVDDLQLADTIREAFGPRLWLEVVRPAIRNAAEQELLIGGLRRGLRFVASTAFHLAVPEEYPVFRLITTVRQTGLLDQLPRRLPIQPAHHLADLRTLRERFRDLPEAVRNTDLLAEQLSSEVLPTERTLPPARAPRGRDEIGFLRQLCERGLRRRGLGESPTAHQRLDEELTVIAGANLAGYFLVVRTIARYARHKGHSMALRGSAGNSLVCYLLEITDVDPLRFRLPMERFLHPARTDLPDIDLDFDWKVRDDVIAHVFRREGPEHTAMICSHLFLQPRSAFREAAKVHGLSNEQISQLLERLAERVDTLLGEEGEPSRCPPGFPLEETRWPRILADAQLLQGRPHHLSIHPGGVVITPGPIADHVPLERAPKGIVITQMDKDAVEQIGLVKIDLLGNRALATVDEAAAVVSGQWSVVSGQWPLLTGHCPLTTDLLRRGDTVGVNQLESPAMRHLLIQMQPRGLDDVIQALAMIRPGAASIGAKELFIRRRRGLEPITYAHPSLEPVLRETCGLMLYEDDAIRVIQALTGLSAPEADGFRKRISKHQTDAEALVLAQEFLEACTRHGVSTAVAADLWVQLAKFNRYSFCKSHAVSYGLIAWKAAFLKVHHPLAFWTAALNNNQGMYPRRVYVEAIKRAGLALRLPCVNRSARVFTVENDEAGPAIRVGLDAIGSLDQELAAAIVADRERRGPYRDLIDFRRRVQPGPEALALLIRSGALDWAGKPRPALFLEADLHERERAGRSKGPSKRKAEGGRRKAESENVPPSEAGGEAPLLPFGDSLMSDADWAPADYGPERRWRDEWAILGFVVGPPLLSLFRSQLPPGGVTSRDLRRHLGRTVRVVGLVAAARQTQTADGRTMQFVTLEDEEGLIEVTLFPDALPPRAYLTLGPYQATGRVDEHYGVLAVTAQQFQRLLVHEARG